MKLVANVTYTVRVRMPSGEFMETDLLYCGGSVTDANGHHVFGGTWAKPASHLYTYVRFGASRLPRLLQGPTKEIRPSAEWYVVPGSGRAIDVDSVTKYGDDGEPTR